MIVPADGTGRCQLDEAETSVRRHFFCSSNKSPTCPYFLNGVANAKHNGNARIQPIVAVRYKIMWREGRLHRPSECRQHGWIDMAGFPAGAEGNVLLRGRIGTTNV